MSEPQAAAQLPRMERAIGAIWQRLGNPTGATFGMPPGLFARSLRRRPELFDLWVAGYREAKQAALAAALADERLLERFRSGRRLPRGFGAALDERIVELPWVAANLGPGAILDAGSALNHAVVLEQLTPRLDLTIVTFTEEERHESLGASYVTADLRDLPFADASFDAVVSVSTLEHVGMDNSEYGSEEPRSDDPDRELYRALAEIRRVVKPGGRLLFTVPFGRREDHGWLRQFDRAGIERMVEAVAPAAIKLDFYAHSVGGWQTSDFESASGGRYRDPRTRSDPEDDWTFAAEAVACLSLDLPR